MKISDLKCFQIDQVLPKQKLEVEEANFVKKSDAEIVREMVELKYLPRSGDSDQLPTQDYI